MHRWGDPFFDWRGINAAADWMASQLLDAGVEVTDWKEKFGTARVYCALGDDQIETYKRVYREAIEKWPHLRAEIIAGADYPEYLEASDAPEVSEA